MEVDTGANASAEEAEEGVDSSSRKVVDIQDSFRLNVRQLKSRVSAGLLARC